MLHPSKSENGEIIEVSKMDAVMHFLGMGWKVLFACCPPPHYCGGWACFVVAIGMIGLVTAIVGEVAGLMGCVFGLRTGLTAITFVAVGTSLPDTFASRKACQQSRYADEAIGNITGSNSVNIFLGCGLPWCIATIYHKVNYDRDYAMPAKGLALAVILYLVFSIIGFIVFAVRRCKLGGELGGGSGRYASGGFFMTLWVIYVIVAGLGTYEVIPDF